MTGLVVGQKRPRVLSWLHAGPLLFGDWGTSRLYVLGLAFSFTQGASPVYLLALSLLMVAVAWAYTVVCRAFPEGGGVYTAARLIHPTLGVIGSTLLMADYIVTAAISIVDAFHYLGMNNGTTILLAAIVTIIVLGLVNWIGAKSAGRFALAIAIVSMIASMFIAVMVAPYIPAGIRNIRIPEGNLFEHWKHFGAIILALSGVEAVANMTGIMKEPVTKTAKRTIWPILGEVATLNLVFGIGLVGLIATMPNLWADPAGKNDVTNTAMRVLAVQSGTSWFGPAAGAFIGRAAGLVFALLLLSAANTVIGGMISVLYSLAHDRELPSSLAKLNYSGVPAIPLVIACAGPIILLICVHEVDALANLYAIGVCGAITLNVACCAVNHKLQMSKADRAGMTIIAFVIGAIFLTIAATKHEALLFAVGLLATVLAARAGVRYYQRRRALSPVPEPELGWLVELQQAPLRMDSGKPRIMLAARGRAQAEFAVARAKKRQATLFAIYVRTLRVLDLAPGAVPRVEDDPQAQESLGAVAVLAREKGVPFVPIYVSSPDIAEEILDYTVTYGCDMLIMGKTRRGLFARQLEGDVVAKVAQHLPDEVALITRESRPDAVEPHIEAAHISETDLGHDHGASLSAADVKAAPPKSSETFGV